MLRFLRNGTREETVVRRLRADSPLEVTRFVVEARGPRACPLAGLSSGRRLLDRDLVSGSRCMKPDQARLEIPGRRKGYCRRITELWRRSMHRDVRWPFRGRYLCSKCGRMYIVPWETTRSSFPRDSAGNVELLNSRALRES